MLVQYNVGNALRCCCCLALRADADHLCTWRLQCSTGGHRAALKVQRQCWNRQHEEKQNLITSY